MITKQVLPDLDYSEYIGKWVVIVNKKIAGADFNLFKLKILIEKSKNPLITKIPKNNTLIF